MKPTVFSRIRAIVSCCLLLSLANSVSAADAPPEDWQAWAKWAENLHPITDAQGHGPDIGSEEWSAALGRRLKISDSDGHGPDPGSKEWRQAVEKKLAPQAPVESRELLSSHEAVARFTGLTDHVCRGLTALCPYRCGYSGKLATFAIIKYVRHEKPGQFGDPRQEQFAFLIEDTMKNPKVPASIRTTVLALKPGDLVDLQWNHDYVTREGSKFPERLIVKISPRTGQPSKKAGEGPK